MKKSWKYLAKCLRNYDEKYLDLSGHLVVIWLSFGCHLVVIWLSFGCHLVVIWQLVGDSTALSQRIWESMWYCLLGELTPKIARVKSASLKFDM